MPSKLTYGFNGNRLDIFREKRADSYPRPYKRRQSQPTPAAPAASPCLSCHRGGDCVARQLACVALEIHENSGRFSPVAPRQPTREIWEGLYAE